ncbi:hypothetical protein PROFUN_15635 [Planoprotostelium fungivorum]|uniref:Uncharacterized protein n=1 Tax=Planoprotostelium fungivorum TaxID=1890364 RepID=A0A2P6MTJ5_9EUKA|nr:hypothetical protein PROFUN_15635 [Planoprotostelium fungivorum]
MVRQFKTQGANLDPSQDKRKGQPRDGKWYQPMTRYHWARLRNSGVPDIHPTDWLSSKGAQESLDAVTITEKKGLADTDGFGEMKMKMSLFSVLPICNPETKRICWGLGIAVSNARNGF